MVIDKCLFNIALLLTAGFCQPGAECKNWLFSRKQPADRYASCLEAFNMGSRYYFLFVLKR
jgi:hypothetical protein